MHQPFGEESKAPDRYQELVYRLIRLNRDVETAGSTSIVLVSPIAGVGVTYVTEGLIRSLNLELSGRCTSEIAVSFRSEGLSTARPPFGAFISRGLESDTIATMAAELRERLTSDEGLSSVSRLSGRISEQHGSCLQLLKSLFKFVVIDCQPLRNSADIVSLAPLVDGIIIVVEAGRTTRSQIDHLVQAIEAAQGNILGYILNKRPYPIPTTVYRAFERAGLI